MRACVGLAGPPGPRKLGDCGRVRSRVRALCPGQALQLGHALVGPDQVSDAARQKVSLRGQEVGSWDLSPQFSGTISAPGPLVDLCYCYVLYSYILTVGEAALPVVAQHSLAASSPASSLTPSGLLTADPTAPYCW